MKKIFRLLVILIVAFTTFKSYSQPNPGTNGDGTSVGNFRVGLEENEFKGIQVFPNPVVQNLNITIPETSKVEFTAEIYSPLGISLQSLKLEIGKNTIDLSTNSSGIYILKIKSDNGVSVKRIVKQ